MRFTVLPVLLPTRFRLTPALAAAFGSDLAMLSAPWTGKAQPFGLPIEAQRPHGILWPVSDEMPQPVVTAIAVLAASGVPCATKVIIPLTHLPPHLVASGSAVFPVHCRGLLRLETLHWSVSSLRDRLRSPRA